MRESDMLPSAGLSPPPTIEQLVTSEYELVGQLTHATLTEFVVEYFIRKRSWLTWMHHAFSACTIVAVILVAVRQGRTWSEGWQAFGLSFVALFLIVLPIHEAIHAVAYRIVGARDIRWDYSPRMLAVWVIAHRFVADARAFLFVAFAPFVVINLALIAGAVLWPRAAVFLLFLLLWHLHGSSGDWALIHFVWLHRRHGFWTYDDAEAGQSWFFTRAMPSVADPLPEAGSQQEAPMRS